MTIELLRRSGIKVSVNYWRINTETNKLEFWSKIPSNKRSLYGGKVNIIATIGGVDHIGQHSFGENESFSRKIALNKAIMDLLNKQCLRY